MFDYQTGTRIKRMKGEMLKIPSKCKLKRKNVSGHAGIVNSVHPARRGEPLVASASDDNTIKLWDTRRKGPIDDLKCKYQMTAVSFNDTSDQVICAGIDNIVKIYDRRAQKVKFNSLCSLILTKCSIVTLIVEYLSSSKQ